MLEAVWGVAMLFLGAVAGAMGAAVHAGRGLGRIEAERPSRAEVWQETMDFEEDMERILARMQDRKNTKEEKL